MSETCQVTIKVTMVHHPDKLPSTDAFHKSFSRTREKIENTELSEGVPKWTSSSSAGRWLSRHLPT
ncbi:MAG: hypothetical protein RJQ09_16165 [Cyclobacteriaceae bacterium]